MNVLKNYGIPALFANENPDKNLSDFSDKFYTFFNEVHTQSKDSSHRCEYVLKNEEDIADYSETGVCVLLLIPHTKTYTIAYLQLPEGTVQDAIDNLRRDLESAVKNEYHNEMNRGSKQDNATSARQAGFSACYEAGSGGASYITTNDKIEEKVHQAWYGRVGESFKKIYDHIMGLNINTLEVFSTFAAAASMISEKGPIPWHYFQLFKSKFGCPFGGLV